MSRPKDFPAMCLLLVATLLVIVCTCPVMGADTDEGKAEAKLKMKLEKKAQEAEKLKEKKEEAERIKRERAEEARRAAEARAAAKAEAERLMKVDAEAKAVADAEILAAKQQMKSQLVDLQAKADHEEAQAKTELEELKKKYEFDKAALETKYKDKKAKAEDKDEVDNEYKAKLLNLSEKYKSDVAKIKQMMAEQKAEISQQKTVIENEYDRKVATANAKARRTSSLARMMNVELPEDNTPKMMVNSVEFSGNILITSAQIIDDMPIIWSASSRTFADTEPGDLYDFRGISEVLLEGTPRQISARTIQGFTSYILSLYQQNNYSGIYVYVPKRAMVGTNQLKDNILLIEVLEAPITTVTVRSYDTDQNMKEEGYLRQNVIKKWSPVKEGSVANEKELNDFVNLLNENPDRYVSATVTRGVKQNTLAVEYDVYEISPWHWFIQLDNAGTRDKQWVPRIGLLNTNLLGIDDKLAVIYQAPWDSAFDDEWSFYGSYDFPLMGPKLRLNVYGGYSQYDINPDAGPFDFIGNGHFYGTILRYNVLQTEADSPIGQGWFFDIKGMYERVRSKLTPSLAPSLALLGTALRSDITFSVWGWGLELHRRNDMSNSTISFERWQKCGNDYNKANFRQARTGANYDFDWYEISGRHSQFLDPNKVHRVSGSVRWVGTQSRLVPAKMTSFGGLYSVRGYDEYEIVADGGLLTRLQYEYDLIAAEEASMTAEEKEQMGQREKDPYEIKRAAPLCFLDYGRTTINHPVAGLAERRHVHLMSVGIGALIEVGDNFSGAVYYGHPLRSTDKTREGKGRVNATFTLKW